MEDGLSCFRHGASDSAGSMSAVAEVTVAALPVGVVVAGFGICDEGSVGDCATGWQWQMDSHQPKEILVYVVGGLCDLNLKLL